MKKKLLSYIVSKIDYVRPLEYLRNAKAENLKNTHVCVDGATVTSRKSKTVLLAFSVSLCARSSF